jgi:hypothetical protein
MPAVCCGSVSRHIVPLLIRITDEPTRREGGLLTDAISHSTICS